MVDLTTGHTRLIIDTCKRHGLLRNQAAYVLATARWETAHTMQPVKEAYWLSETWRKNNLRYYPWYGRGFVQLTWETNYQRAAREIGVPIDKRPELALDAPTAAEILVRGMSDGWFTGKKLSHYITLRASNFASARRIVNGTDKASEIAALAREYDALLKAEGYGEASKPAAPTSPNPNGGILSILIHIIKKLFGG